MKVEKFRKDFETWKKEVYNWSVLISVTIQKLGLAVDDQDRKILQAAIEIDKSNRLDTDKALNSAVRNQNFNLTQSSQKINSIMSQLNQTNDDINKIKENPNISLIYHDSIFKEMEKKISEKLNKKELSNKELDNYLFEVEKLPRTRIRKFNNKEYNLTLPMYIRHHFHHQNNDENVIPTHEEIKESIFSVLKILKK